MLILVSTWWLKDNTVARHSLCSTSFLTEGFGGILMTKLCREHITNLNANYTASQLCENKRAWLHKSRVRFLCEKGQSKNNRLNEPANGILMLVMIKVLPAHSSCSVLNRGAWKDMTLISRHGFDLMQLPSHKYLANASCKSSRLKSGWNSLRKCESHLREKTDWTLRSDLTLKNPRNVKLLTE